MSHAVTSAAAHELSTGAPIARTLRIVGLVTAAGLALLAGGSARAEDFDCARAKLAAEKTVCANDYLRRLDDRTATLYGLLWGRLDNNDREGLRDHQLAFLERRNACGPREHCVAAAYREQIGTLAEQLARNPKP